MARIIVCANCGEEKPHHGKGLCVSCYHQSWRAKYPEKISAYNKNYYQEHQEEERARRRRYYRENREKELAYHHRNLEAGRAKRARRQARKLVLPDTLTPQQAEHLMLIGRAIYPDQELHLDHIVPISKGGGTTLANMHAIPANLNLMKAGELPENVYGQLSLGGGT